MRHLSMSGISKSKIRKHLKEDMKEAKESIHEEKEEIRKAKTGITRDKILIKSLKKGRK
jgi:hypothetical protein